MEKNKIPPKNVDILDYNDLLDQIEDSDSEKNYGHEFNDMSTYSK